MEAIGGKILGGVVGGLMGGSDDTQQQTATKAPWEAVGPWLREQIGTGRQLQDYYQRQPFNALQQTGYQNQFADQDQFRNQIAPGLMNFANNAMTSQYTRGPRQSLLEAQQGNAPIGAMTGITPQMAPNKPQLMTQGADGTYSPSGLLGRPQGVFSMAPGSSYGAPDWAQLNPFTATNGIKEPEKPAAVAAPEVDPANKPYNWRDEYDKLLRGQLNYGGGA